jgi:hypothetical protein
MGRKLWSGRLPAGLIQKGITPPLHQGGAENRVSPPDAAARTTSSPAGLVAEPAIGPRTAFKIALLGGI